MFGFARASYPGGCLLGHRPVDLHLKGLAALGAEINIEQGYVSAKGAVSLYGIRRFPVTFYVEEWKQILEMGDEIKTYMGEHASELKTKGSR